MAFPCRCPGQPPHNETAFKEVGVIFFDRASPRERRSGNPAFRREPRSRRLCGEYLSKVLTQRGPGGRYSCVSGHSTYRRGARPVHEQGGTRGEIRWRRAAAQPRVRRESLLKYLAPGRRRDRTRVSALTVTGWFEFEKRRSSPNKKGGSLAAARPCPNTARCAGVPPSRLRRRWARWSAGQSL